MQTWIDHIIGLQKTLPAYVPGKFRQKRTGDPHTNDIIKGLFVAVLAIYGKLYPPAKGRHVCLDPKAIKGAENRRVHNELLSFRHNFAAHSGDELHEKCAVVAVVAPVSSFEVTSMVTCELAQPSSWGSDQWNQVSELISELRTITDERIKKLHQQIREEELSNDALEVLLELYIKAGAWKW